MPFFTRPELTNDQFKQLVSSVLTLSGETNFHGTLKSKDTEINASTTGGTLSGYVLTFDGTKVRLLPPTSGGSGNYIYDDTSTIAVGGIPAGYPLSGESFSDLFQKLLVVYQVPTFPTFNINISSLNEVGNPAGWSGNKTFTWSTTNSGNVQSNTISIIDVTSGNVVLGSGLANDGTEVLNLGTLINNVTPISHTWRVQGTNTELNAMTPKTTTITSIYPWFYGTFDAGAVPAGNNRPDVSNAVTAQLLVDGGTKVLASSNGTVIPNFASSTEDYIWIALPVSSNLKTVWYVNALNNGIIGGAISPGGNLFPDPVTTVIDSPDTFWSGIQYRFYLSNKQTAVNNMEFRNS